jgi:hypothetical protein
MLAIIQHNDSKQTTILSVILLVYYRNFSNGVFLEPDIILATMPPLIFYYVCEFFQRTGPLTRYHPGGNHPFLHLHLPRSDISASSLSVIFKWNDFLTGHDPLMFLFF